MRVGLAEHFLSSFKKKMTSITDCKHWWRFLLEKKTQLEYKRGFYYGTDMLTLSFLRNRTSALHSTWNCTPAPGTCSACRDTCLYAHVHAYLVLASWHLAFLDKTLKSIQRQWWQQEEFLENSASHPGLDFAPKETFGHVWHQSSLSKSGATVLLASSG